MAPRALHEPAPARFHARASQAARSVRSPVQPVPCVPAVAPATRASRATTCVAASAAAASLEAVLAPTPVAGVLPLLFPAPKALIMAFTFAVLPYPHDALAPFMSKETLEYLHDKHHQA